MEHACSQFSIQMCVYQPSNILRNFALHELGVERRERDLLAASISYSRITGKVPILSKGTGDMDFIRLQSVSEAIVMKCLTSLTREPYSRAGKITIVHLCEELNIPVSEFANFVKSGIDSIEEVEQHGWLDLAKAANLSDALYETIKELSSSTWRIAGIERGEQSVYNLSIGTNG